MARKLGSKDKKKRKSRVSQKALIVNLNASSAYYKHAKQVVAFK